MHTYKTTIIAPLLSSLLIAACASEAPTRELPADLDDLSGGKADDPSANIEWEDTDNELFSARLRSLVCSEIRSEFPSIDCDDLRHRVVRVGTSKIIQYTEDQRPVTMSLQVEVEHLSSNETFFASLDRGINDAYGLSFGVSVTSELSEEARFIRQLARDGGEFPEIWEWKDEGLVREIAFVDLNSDIQDIFNDVLAERVEDLQRFEEADFADAMFAEDLPFTEIMLFGEPIGYIVQIWDSINHPLWDGSGVTVYFDRFGTELASEEWSG